MFLWKLLCVMSFIYMSTHVIFPILKDWSLELEEVYVLDRDGESNKYSRYKNNLHNKMLLWHGKQLFWIPQIILVIAVFQKVFSRVRRFCPCCFSAFKWTGKLVSLSLCSLAWLYLNILSSWLIWPHCLRCFSLLFSEFPFFSPTISWLWNSICRFKVDKFYWNS